MSISPQHPPPPIDPERLAKLAAWCGRDGIDPSAPGKESRVLDPFQTPGATQPYHLRIREILQDLLDHNASPSQTAKALAACVMSVRDPNGAWSWLGGTLCKAAEHHFHPHLERLAEVLVHLVKLPHHLPPSDENDALDGGTSFSNLPRFDWMFGEWMQGPNQYYWRMDIVTRSAQLAAMTRWRNLSAFAAILSRLHAQGSLPKCIDLRSKAYYDLAIALEYKVRDSEVEFNDIKYIYLRDFPLLWIPAAAEWISIAGREVFDAAFNEGRQEPRRAKPGGLWAPAGSNDAVTIERWAFWRQRMTALAEDDRLRPEVSSALGRAVGVLDGIDLPEDDS